jgi:glycosyltransferase involved in cell wall biosynthesis
MIASGEMPLPQGLKMPRLVVAGSGELEAFVVEASHRHGDALLRHVPAPTREKLLRLLSEASIAVSPALYGESFGIILVEALASGTPVIAASNAGYVNQIVNLPCCKGNPQKALGRWGCEHASNLTFLKLPRVRQFRSYHKLPPLKVHGAATN